MKRILYLSLLLVIPFFLHADHGRNRINGKWISPYFDTQIKIKVKRHELKVKGLSRRGWTYFIPVRRNVFEDCNGNQIRIKNIHDLVYINRYRGERIRFVKKGHNHHNHNCNSRCSIGEDYFSYQGQQNNYDNYYGDGYYDDWGYDDNERGYRDRRNRGSQDRNYSNSRLDGRYHVREIDEYVTLNRTRNGIKAKRGNGNWVEYTQNRYRKNEYIDRQGNKYLVRSDGDITWKSKNGKISFNLQK